MPEIKNKSMKTPVNYKCPFWRGIYDIISSSIGLSREGISPGSFEQFR